MIAETPPVEEVIAADLLTALDEILNDAPSAATASRRPSRGLRSRHSSPAALSGADAARIRACFDRSVRPLLHAASQRIAPYPTAELHRMASFAHRQPAPGEQQLPYLRRFGLAILAVLDLLGDDE
ncbi:hypothetical protein ACWCWD_22725 [Streptomyces sp. NPDC001493]